MTARFERAWSKASRAHLAASVGVLLTLSGLQSAAAARGRRRGFRPEVCRLGAGEILIVPAIASGLWCGNASLSEARRAVFEH